MSVILWYIERPWAIEYYKIKIIINCTKDLRIYVEATVNRGFKFPKLNEYLCKDCIIFVFVNVYDKNKTLIFQIAS